MPRFSALCLQTGLLGPGEARGAGRGRGLLSLRVASSGISEVQIQFHIRRPTVALQPFPTAPGNQESTTHQQAPSQVSSIALRLLGVGWGPVRDQISGVEASNEGGGVSKLTLLSP